MIPYNKENDLELAGPVIPSLGNGEKVNNDTNVLSGRSPADLVAEVNDETSKKPGLAELVPQPEMDK